MPPPPRLHTRALPSHDPDSRCPVEVTPREETAEVCPLSVATQVTLASAPEGGRERENTRTPPSEQPVANERPGRAGLAGRANSAFTADGCSVHSAAFSKLCTGGGVRGWGWGCARARAPRGGHPPDPHTLPSADRRHTATTVSSLPVTSVSGSRHAEPKTVPPCGGISSVDRASILRVKVKRHRVRNWCYKKERARNE